MTETVRYLTVSVTGATGWKGISVVPKEPIVAVALLTQTNLDMLGKSLKTVFKIDKTPCFGELLRAIDEADREHWREEDRQEALSKLREESCR